MVIEFDATGRRLGIVSAITVALLLVAYATTLTVGFISLESPSDQIGDPMFSILEILIIALMPAMVALMVAVYSWAPVRQRTLGMLAVIFMSLLAGVTMSLHFVILCVSRQPAFAALPWLPLLTSFTWPSVAYALDILAWDVFFALSMLFAAPCFRGGGLAAWVRGFMVASGVLALAGLSGVVAGDMALRNIGIVGYVPVFLVVTLLLARLFSTTEVREGRAA